MANLTMDTELINKPKQKYWITYILQRIKKNKNFLGFISGQTGSGKSWSSISICEDLDSDFNIERIVFTGLELMDLINSGTLKRGSCIIFEESGVAMSNKNWYSTTNKMLNYLVQTFRHRGFILIMNSPFMDFVDASTRKLFHAELQTQGIDFNKEECKLKPQLIQYNSRMKKFYYKRLKVIRAEGIVPVDIWRVKKPTTELIKAYEQKKRDYTDNLNKRIYDELLQQHNKNNPKKTSDLTNIQQETLELLQQGFNVEQVAEKRGRIKDVIYKTMKLMEKKGYQFKGVYNGKNISNYEVITPEMDS